jgi:hypothetical protein
VQTGDHFAFFVPNVEFDNSQPLLTCAYNIANIWDVNRTGQYIALSNNNFTATSIVPENEGFEQPSVIALKSFPSTNTLDHLTHIFNRTWNSHI